MLVALTIHRSPSVMPAWMRSGSSIRQEELLRPHRALRAVLFGHIHQHWQGAWATRPDVLLLGCPSTLCTP